ncbi:MAG: cytochrome c maturation protein CcmE [Promethearchaeota archaeon]
MIRSKNLMFAIIIMFVSVSALLFLLSSSSVPVFSVKELKSHSQPSSFLNHNIQVVGVVQDINSTGFFITDPEDVTNSSLIIYINATNVEKPVGFESGKTILVEGKLISTTGMWKLKASMISTKCPSKYTE